MIPVHDVDPVAVLAALPPDTDAVAVRDGAATVVAAAPEEIVSARGAAALDVLDTLDSRPGWWAGWLAYDLGRAVEQVAARALDDLGLPDLLLARFGARLVLNPPGPGGEPPLVHLEGGGASRGLLEEALAGAPRASVGIPRLAHWRSSLSRPQWDAAVAEVLELIRAGDCYQVNLARRLTCDHPSAPADAVALFAALRRHNPAPHEAFVRLGPWTVVSASPERFLRQDADLVETRPIKGTASDPGALAASAKDHAENVMIVDLARNDLGRVCRYGTVKVPSLCAVEAHPGLHHLVSVVEGRLRPGTGLGALIRATFPPASVTGAPKPRVLQAIEDLEPVRRGVYCGAIGFFDTERHRTDLNVAIRTFMMSEGQTLLGVGGGIVADSDPAHEWAETELKARRLLRAAGAASLAPVGG